MRLRSVSLRSGKTWWWLFAILIAAPALTLALLGLRVVRLERMEREQELREQQTQLARLADTTVTNAVGDFENKLTRSEGPAGLPPEWPVFVLEPGGRLVFPRDKVYFPDSSAIEPPKASPWTQKVAELIERAQAAEAQQRGEEAVSLYAQVRKSEPRLTAWADLEIARIQLSRGNALARTLLIDPVWSRSDGETPGGLPVALLASAEIENAPPGQRARFLPLLRATLDGLRAGRWWFNIEERRFHDAELRRLFELAGSGPPAEDPRLERWSAIAALARRARPDQDAPPFSDSEPDGDILLLWSRSPQQPGAWLGFAVPRSRIAAAAAAALHPVFSGQSFHAAVRHVKGPVIWSESTAPVPVASVTPLHSVAGWELVLGNPVRSSGFDQRSMLWYGFTIVLVLTLGAGVVVTTYVVQREAEIGRLQSEFIAAVTHEFKSPITSIRLLMERLSGGRLRTPAAAEEYYDAISRETDRLDRLVSRVLESQKIQAGEKRYNLVPGSVVESAESAIWRLRPQADSKNMTVDLELAGDIPAIRMDKAAITETLDNLVDNAIKYSPSGSRVLILVEARGRHVCVEVRDEGIGIDEEDMPHIFDRFYRGRRGDQHDVHGTGLGLALVREAAEGHGGTVEVTSAPGRGTRFCLRLPVEE